MGIDENKQQTIKANQSMWMNKYFQNTDLNFKEF